MLQIYSDIKYTHIHFVTYGMETEKVSFLILFVPFPSFRIFTYIFVP